MKLNIVVPCYNEEAVLQETTKQLSLIIDALIKEGKISYCNIVYVDDGSKDSTWSLIEHLQSENKYVHGLKLAHNVGHQHALWAGLEYSADKCDAVVSIDADLQDDVSVIEQMIDEYKNGCDVVFGVRKERKTDTVFKRTTALAFYKLMQKMGVDIVYNHADFRLTSQRATQELMQYPERNMFVRGMVKLLGYKSSEVYYDRKERFAGESKYPIKKMINFALDGITSFSLPDAFESQDDYYLSSSLFSGELDDLWPLSFSAPTSPNEINFFSWPSQYSFDEDYPRDFI